MQFHGKQLAFQVRHGVDPVTSATFQSRAAAVLTVSNNEEELAVGLAALALRMDLRARLRSANAALIEVRIQPA